MLEICLTAGTKLQERLGMVSIKFRQADSSVFADCQPLTVLFAEFAWRNEVFAEVSTNSSLPESSVVTARHHRNFKKSCHTAEELISVLLSRLKFHGKELSQELEYRAHDIKPLLNL